MHPVELDEPTKKLFSKRLKRPEGKFPWDLKYDEDMFNPEIGRFRFLEIATGQIVVRVERESNLNVNFIHASPSTGTRIATVNIAFLKGKGIQCRFILGWSPAEINLTIGIIGSICGRSVSWKKADYQLRVGTNGVVYEIGCKGLELMDLQVVENGKTVLQNTAIESWADTIKAIGILQTGTSSEGFAYENLLCNQLIVMLCTSFEVYCKRRFLELVDEGLEPNYSNLEQIFFTKAEREKSLIKELEEQAKSSGHTLAHEIVERKRIDFGNYQKCKDAFVSAYGLKFSEMGVDRTVNTIVQFIKYRHEIVHVSPCSGCLNINELPKKEPVMASKVLINHVLKDFNEFINGLHKVTLTLRPLEKTA